MNEIPPAAFWGLALAIAGWLFANYEERHRRKLAEAEKRLADCVSVNEIMARILDRQSAKLTEISALCQHLQPEHAARVLRVIGAILEQEQRHER